VNIAFIFAPEMVAGRPLDFTRLWDDDRGLTGSESSILIFARELAKRGHKVSLYIEHPNAGSFDGVLVVDLNRFERESQMFDVAISWIYSRFFRGMSPNVLRVNFQTCNSFDYEAPNFEDDVDLFFSPSRHHCEYMQKWTLTSRRKWEVMRLGCYPDDYPGWDSPVVVPGRVVYTSSPDRGLHLLLQEWPAIRAAVPGATLRIFYHALDKYIREAGATPKDAQVTIDRVEHGCRARFIESALKRLEGVEVIGSVSRARMRRELSEAMVLAYPCETVSYSEGFSVSTLEGCASGALPILAECDALGDVYRGAVPMVPAPARKHIVQWRELVIRSLTAPSWRALQVAKARDFALSHDYRDIVVDMEKSFDRGIERKRTAPPVWTSNAPIGIDFVLTRFAAGDDPIDPENYEKESRGGGSRSGCMHLAHAMKRRPDYHVRVYANISRDVPGFFPLEHFDKHAPRDVLFAYYDTSALRDAHEIRLRIASHHTYVPPDVWFSSHADISTAPTEHAVDALRRGFDPHGKWYVLPNGVKDPFISWQPVSGRVIYHTSPDRGLHLLLKMWPEIRRAVPYATLHVIGDVAGASWNDAPLFPSFARTTPGSRIMALRDGMAAAKAAGGVEFLGKVSRDLLRHELGRAACFAFPCSVAMPCETFSVCIMECMQAGVPVVLSPQDALGFYDDIAVCTPAPVEEHMSEFVDAVVHVLRSLPKQLSCHYMGRRFAVRYTHDRMATVLDGIIQDNLR
jgi:glycosyltransferase involved in cell wall biosynthesis